MDRVPRSDANWPTQMHWISPNLGGLTKSLEGPTRAVMNACRRGLDGLRLGCMTAAAIVQAEGGGDIGILHVPLTLIQFYSSDLHVMYDRT